MVLAVIPARLGSSRFPRKVLYPIDGQPLLYHVWRSVKKAKRVDRVVIASSDREILDVAKSFGAETFRTSTRHKTGSDRSAEVAKSIPAAIVANVQADTFDLPASALNRVIEFLQQHRTVLAATMIYPISAGVAQQSDRVKVVMGEENRAMWFSRAAIPYPQSSDGNLQTASYFGHVGVYVYRRKPLLTFARARQTAAERIESLEQLRFLEVVGPMHAITLSRAPRSIDRPEDLQVRRLFGSELD